MSQTTTIIPANPGFIALWEQDGELFKGDAIIAWAITTESSKEANDQVRTLVQPVLIDPTNQCTAILHPDGRVTETFDLVHESFEEAGKEVLERYRRTTK